MQIDNIKKIIIEMQIMVYITNLFEIHNNIKNKMMNLQINNCNHNNHKYNFHIKY